MIRDLDFDFTRQPWMVQGNCRNDDVDPDWFFPEYGNTYVAKAAIAVCRKCPVQKECLEYAIKYWPLHGIWGGLDNKEIKARVKERKINERTNNNKGSYRQRFGHQVFN